MFFLVFFFVKLVGEYIKKSHERMVVYLDQDTYQFDSLSLLNIDENGRSSPRSQ